MRRLLITQLTETPTYWMQAELQEVNLHTFVDFYPLFQL